MILPQRQLHILAGASGAGKTTLLLQALQAWDKGQPFPLSFTAHRVGYIVADRTKEETEDKASQLHLSDRVEFYGLVDDEKFSLALLQNPVYTLNHVVGQLSKPFDLLVLDPIMIFMEGSTNQYHQVAKSLLYISRMAKKRGVTVLATHHATKPRSDFHFLRPQDRILGSAAFQGYSGTQMVLIEGSEDNMSVDSLHLIPHAGPPEEYNFVRGQGGWFEQVLTEEQNFISGLPAEFSTRDALLAGQAQEVSRATVYRELAKMYKIGHGKYTKKNLTEA